MSYEIEVNGKTHTIEGFVYFIQGENTKLIKIGKSFRDPKNRLRILQIGSPDRLSIVGIIGTHRKEAAGELESSLHKRFNDYRVSGEWFRPEKEILKCIETNCKFGIETLILNE